MEKPYVAKVKNTYFLAQNPEKGTYYMVKVEMIPYDYFSMLDYILDEAISASDFSWEDVAQKIRGKETTEVYPFVVSLLQRTGIEVTEEEIKKDLAQHLILRVEKEEERKEEALRDVDPTQLNGDIRVIYLRKAKPSLP